MARRKNNLADKLNQRGNEGRSPGWRDMISPETPAEPETESAAPSRRRNAPPPPKTPPRNRKRRKTYYLPEYVIQDIEELAAQEQVGISDLATYLLDAALNAVHQGDLAIPTRTAKQKIDY